MIALTENRYGSLVVCLFLFLQIISPTLMVGKAASAEFIVLAPNRFYVGTESSVSISSFSPDTGRPVDRRVSLFIRNQEKEVELFRGRTGPDGHLIARFDVPGIEKGTYDLVLAGRDDREHVSGEVILADSVALLIETDKPIYKPGQTLYGRVLALSADLKPTETKINVSISDAKGIKVFRKELSANEFGVASFELSLAKEVNTGTWKITANSESGTATVDFRVEKYVLPKFDVGVETPKGWFLVDEEITGQVNAEYFFGKPVEGTVFVEAYKYVAHWEKFATFNSRLSNGVAEFEIPAAGYLAGTVGSGGLGSVILNVTVTDGAGHEEKDTKLLKVADSPTVIQVIPASQTVKPGLPMDVMIVTETPDGEPLDKSVEFEVVYRLENGKTTRTTRSVNTFRGMTTVEIDVPDKCTSADLKASLPGSESENQITLNAQYSPGGYFVHIVQISPAEVSVGEEVTFEVLTTADRNAYYDVVSGGRTIHSGYADGRYISFKVTPDMMPKAKLVAYVINPNLEVAADSIPFDVDLVNPVNLSAEFSKDKCEPGEEVTLDIESSSGVATMIGLSIVDESVYALNEGRLNLKQVFNELEKIFMRPQAEAHPDGHRLWPLTERRGSMEVFEDAGIQVMTSSSLDVPQGQPDWLRRDGLQVLEAAGGDNFAAPKSQSAGQDSELAEVKRVRQFFPETWYWNPTLMTDETGRASVKLTAPDTITTWKLHAVSSSPQGIGMTEGSLKVFQDFFVEPDLPYAVTRGEEFPVLVQIYNYVENSQKVQVELKEDSWFQLVDERVKIVTVPGNSVASIGFTIRPEKVGQFKIEITARTHERADAVKRNIRVEPEGTPCETVVNDIITEDSPLKFNLSMPPAMVDDSGTIQLAVTPSMVAQTINGVDDLLGMPYGCGEQNMMFMAPDLEILRYLDATGQIKPEIRAKAEHFLTTGYQRELTFRRSDGSFSAFGENDDQGSLFLTSFVLDIFSECREVMSIDSTVLSDAASWIGDHQNGNGSFSPVGFVCHQEMLGGLDPSSRSALTAFVGIALSDYGNAEDSLQAAVQYIEENAIQAEDPYTLALAALLLEKVGSPHAEQAISRLLEMARTDEHGIFWAAGSERSNAVETTSYAALALMLEGRSEAEQAVRWLSSQRNSLGGFCSTQDTVWALKALMKAARLQTRTIDSSIEVKVDGEKLTTLELTAENFDVLNVIDIPLAGEELVVEMKGEGEVTIQLAKRFNLPGDLNPNPEFELDIEYNTTSVEVDDIVHVLARARYTGAYNSTGMMILDISVPTGFSPVHSSLEQVISDGLATRYEIGGRKVIFYVDDLQRGEELEIGFDIRALLPVKAKGGTSTAYSYYKPEVRTEARGVDFQVSGEVASRFGDENMEEPSGDVGFRTSTGNTFPLAVLSLLIGCMVLVFGLKTFGARNGI